MSPKADAQNYDDAAFAEVVRDDEFITMHAIKKKIQSFRDASRWLDFLLGMPGQVFDIVFLTETWRSETEEFFLPPLGYYIYRSGGCSHQGVGLCVAKSFHDQITCCQFHAYSCPVCALRLLSGT